MFYLLTAIILVVPLLLGGYLLFTPMDRLIAGVAWMRLPMPKAGSSAYTALRLFWRSIGTMAFGFVGFMIWILIAHRA